MSIRKKNNKFLSWGLLIVAFTAACESPSTTPSTQSNTVKQSSPSSAPQVKGVGLGCEDKYCIWITGNNFDPKSTVELRKSDDSAQVLVKYNEVVIGSQGADQVITIPVKEEEARNALNTSGVKVRVIGSENGLYSESEIIKRLSAK